MYLEQLFGEIRKQNVTVNILDEFEWLGDEHGNVRKTITERPFLGSAFEIHREQSVPYVGDY